MRNATILLALSHWHLPRKKQALSYTSLFYGGANQNDIAKGTWLGFQPNPCFVAKTSKVIFFSTKHLLRVGPLVGDLVLLVHELLHLELELFDLLHVSVPPNANEQRSKTHATTNTSGARHKTYSSANERASKDNGSTRTLRCAWLGKYIFVSCAEITPRR